MMRSISKTDNTDPPVGHRPKLTGNPKSHQKTCKIGDEFLNFDDLAER